MRLLDRIKEFRDEGLGRAGFRSTKSARLGQDERSLLEVVRASRTRLMNTRFDAFEDIKAARKAGGMGLGLGLRERFAPEKEEEQPSDTERGSWRSRHGQAKLPRSAGQEVKILS